MDLSKLEGYSNPAALVEDLRRLTTESEIKHHGCCQVVVQTFLDILGVENEALSMASSPFVGGVALTGNNCGAVIGGLMVLGTVFGRKDLKEGMPGILTGVILGLERAAVETAPILFTGAAFYLPTLPTSPLDPTMALPYHIYVISTQVPGMPITIQYATVLVLLSFVLVMNLIATLVRSRARARRQSCHGTCPCPPWAG